jgi:hypothetical protein
MGKKPLTFGERLQKKVDQINKRTQDNFVMYAKACSEQGKQVGEPIDIMSLLGKKK